IRPRELTRCCALLQQAGGKGANVTRALNALRGEARCFLLGFAAGHTGRLFAELATEEGLAVELVACAGEMRLSTAVLTDDGSVSRLFECGPSITPHDEESLLTAVADHRAAEGEWAVVDGAVPPGAGNDFYSAICRTLSAVGYRVLVDATGAQLAACLDAVPDFVKVNLSEAWSAVGTPQDLREDEDRLSVMELGAEGLEMARRLVAAGARGAVVTLGAAGAAGLIGGREWNVRTPPIRIRNAVGSGDCFAAALVAGFESREPVEAALATAAGVAAANAASALTAHFDADLARRLARLACVGPPIA
ncbi:MAG TPA: PfkB family carbohydrate kinase, partial [Thermoleophilia bacterium]|nr:PfkB family carbohydrate kinase [Thermoleophilia bacterium]